MYQSQSAHLHIPMGLSACKIGVSNVSAIVLRSAFVRLHSTGRRDHHCALFTMMAPWIIRRVLMRQGTCIWHLCSLVCSNAVVGPFHMTRSMPTGRSAHGLTHYRKPGSVVLLCMGGHGYGYEYFGDVWSLELPITPAQAPPAPAEPEPVPARWVK